MKPYAFKDFTIWSGNDVIEGLLADLIAGDYSKVFVLVDENTEKHCLPIVSKFLFDIHSIRIPSGENAKNLESAQLVWNELLAQEADRKSVLICLGGGVLSDLGGFCAATYKRGIDCIQVPTTLLAMVDSSMGGKTGVNLNHVKNMIGVIRQPKAVYIYPPFLKTLPRTEWINGEVEMLKHGLITDKKYWEKVVLATSESWSESDKLIMGSVKIKMDIVKQDPYEKNERKLLNFGHTIGHAIEAYSLKHDKTPLHHGEAVAIGMICEAYLSKLITGLSSSELKEITDILKKKAPKFSLRTVLSPELIKYMRNDKKNTDEKINFTLLKKIGKGTVNHTCTDAQIALALNYYDAL